jgi:hypothetical protein
MQNQLKSLGQVKRVSPRGSSHDRLYAITGGIDFHDVAGWSGGMFMSRLSDIASPG